MSYDRVVATLKLVDDPWGPARTYSAEHPEFRASWEADAAYTVGYLSSTVGALLDLLGYPRQGPVRNQRSWLLEEEEDE
jgi:hypothetical protein